MTGSRDILDSFINKCLTGINYDLGIQSDLSIFLLKEGHYFNTDGTTAYKGGYFSLDTVESFGTTMCDNGPDTGWILAQVNAPNIIAQEIAHGFGLVDTYGIPGSLMGSLPPSQGSEWYFTNDQINDIINYVINNDCLNDCGSNTSNIFNEWIYTACNIWTNIPNEWTYTNQLGHIYNFGNNWFASWSPDGKNSVNMNVFVEDEGIGIQDFCEEEIWGYTNELGWIYFKDANGLNYILALDKWVYFNSPPSANGVWFFTYDGICGFTGSFYANQSSATSKSLYSTENGDWFNWDNCQNLQKSSNNPSLSMLNIEKEPNPFNTTKNNHQNNEQLSFLDSKIPNRVILDNKYSALTNQTELKVSPNPFKQNTNIVYNLSESSFVTISVLDCIGKIVTVLENETLKEKGQHEMKFYSTLSQGIYVINIQSDNFSISQKIIVMN